MQSTLPLPGYRHVPKARHFEPTTRLPIKQESNSKQGFGDTLTNPAPPRRHMPAGNVSTAVPLQTRKHLKSQPSRYQSYQVPSTFITLSHSQKQHSILINHGRSHQQRQSLAFGQEDFHHRHGRTRRRVSHSILIRVPDILSLPPCHILPSDKSLPPSRDHD